MHIGIQNQLEFPDSSSCNILYARKVVTLHDLLSALDETNVVKPQLHAMLRSTAGHLMCYLDKQPEDIMLETLPFLKQGFASYLRERRYRRASVRSYTGYLNILTKTAVELGFTPDPAGAVAEWNQIVHQMRTRRRCDSIVSYAISLGKKPADFSDSDLECWYNVRLAQGRSRASVVSHKGWFRKQVFQCGLGKYFPRLSPPTSSCYALPLPDFPEPLRTEVEKLLTWKTDRMAEGRAGKKRLREVSARNLRVTICQLVGYVHRVMGETVTNLESLLKTVYLTNFLMWCINVRKVTSKPLACKLGALWAAVRDFPDLKGHDLSWMAGLASQLPEDDENARVEAKRKKWVDYDTLLTIPERIRAETTKRLPQGSPIRAKQMALYVCDQLLVNWLLVLPWRQRNLRECKLGSREQGGNLFRGELDLFSTIAKPTWVKECLQKNPHEEFWQFYFRENETKTRHVVHSLVPKQLIPLLEDYLGNYRPLLIKGTDPGFLFLNSEGKPLTAGRLEDIVETWTARFTGRRVNPHLFRDIVAITWLKEHPEDYLTLSKLLWHRNINTTLQIYGRNFDESHGVRRMEEWLEIRECRS